MQIGHGNLIQAVTGFRRVQQISAQCGIKGKIRRFHAFLQQRQQVRLAVMHGQRICAGKQLLQHIPPCRIASLICPQYISCAFRQQAQGSQGMGGCQDNAFFSLQCGKQGVCIHLFAGDFLFRCSFRYLFRRLQPQPGNQVLKFQPGKQVVQCRLVHLHRGQIPNTGFQRHIPHNGHKEQSLLRTFPILQQLAPLAFLDKRIINVVIYRLYRAEFLNQSHGGFFTDAGYARNIIRGISHQCLEINHMNWVKAVLLPEYFCGIFRGGGLSPAGHCQQDRGSTADQLQGILITCDNQAGISPLIGFPAQGTQQVICFIARLFQIRNAHGSQYLPNQRQLLCQFLRHAFSGSLICFIRLMAEGFFLYVKAHHNPIRLILLL